MEKYKDIINLPHKQSSKRPHMSLLDRAAQFAPFAALVGYDDAIKETGRLTDERIEMSVENLAVLNASIRYWWTTWAKSRRLPLPILYRTSTKPAAHMLRRPVS